MLQFLEAQLADEMENCGRWKQHAKSVSLPPTPRSITRTRSSQPSQSVRSHPDSQRFSIPRPKLDTGSLRGVSKHMSTPF